MTFDKFVETYNGHAIDYDGGAGVQCFTKNHYVLMADKTYKAIQDIQVGDLVVGYDNQLNNVIQTHKHLARVYKVRTDLGDIEVTKEHPFYFTDGCFYNIFEIGEKEPALFDNKNKEESGFTDNELRFLGFWLGDGSLCRHHDKNAEVRITYGKNKAEYIESLDIISSKTERKNSKGSFDARISRKEHEKLCDFIYTCYNEKLEKILPLVFTNREYKLILEGLIKADGTKKRNSVVITNTSKSLLLSIQAICILLGCTTKSLRLHKRGNQPILINGKKVKNIKPIYWLTINNSNSAKFRKPQIISIEDLGEQEVYNIGTDNTHTYICNNYKVHNCVDLAKLYMDKVLGITPRNIGNAEAYWNRFDEIPELRNNFSHIPNDDSYFPEKRRFSCLG